jgi:ATP-dependent Clp protease ATP-binding subunit ClpA
LQTDSNLLFSKAAERLGYPMDKVSYPLLYFSLQPNAVLGVLVGTGFEALDKDAREVKSILKNHLQRQYKKSGIYSPYHLLAPKLKTLQLPIKPTYTDTGGSYPLHMAIRVPVVAIYGQKVYGDFECVLPLLGQRFHYYEADQLDTLIQHFATTLLNQMQPDDLYQLLQYPEPTLDELSLKIKPDRYAEWGNFFGQRDFETLNSLAERFPYPKNIRKRLSPLPDAAWELEDKVSEVMDKITATRSDVLVVGKPGVGKSAVLMQAIRRITARNKGQQQGGYTFWRLLPQRITASARYLGEWEQTCENLVEELALANGILWIENIIQLLQMGGGGPENSVAAFLTAFMQQGRLQLVGEATPQELESMRRLLPGFVTSFQVIHLEELPELKAQAVMQKLAEFAEKNLDITVEREAQTLAYRLLLRYYPYESFPGKGIRFLGRCINELQIKEQHQLNRQVVIENFVAQTGLPELFLRDDLILDQLELQQFFSSRIIGQPGAVQRMTEIVKVFKAGLNNPYKPIATLIFAGPTGVGKTACAKALADYFFGKGQQQSPLIRIDMSEFQHAGQISRLIGHGQEVGQLVKEVRERPFAVVLFDEVEKADPSIFDALLTVLDEGMLVDAYGRVTNFRNTIIIMTSNLGASNRTAIGFQHTTDDETRYLSAIGQHFRPEFFNRIDGVVLFKSLEPPDIERITRKELDELKHREGFLKRRLNLHFTDALVQHLARTGFDERYGARPLQRAVEQTVTNPLAHWLLEHPTVEDCRLVIDYENGVRILRN